MQLRHLEAMAKWFKELVGWSAEAKAAARQSKWVSAMPAHSTSQGGPKVNVDEQWWTLFCLMQSKSSKFNGCNMYCELSQSSTSTRIQTFPTHFLLRGVLQAGLCVGNGLKQAQALVPLFFHGFPWHGWFMVVYGGLIGALNDFSIFQYLQNDSTEGLGCRWPILSSKTSAMLWPQLLTTSPKKLGSPSSDIGCCGWLYTVECF